jgi:hypothetical protein
MSAVSVYKNKDKTQKFQDSIQISIPSRLNNLYSNTFYIVNESDRPLYNLTFTANSPDKCNVTFNKASISPGEEAEMTVNITANQGDDLSIDLLINILYDYLP